MEPLVMEVVTSSPSQAWGNTTVAEQTQQATNNNIHETIRNMDTDTQTETETLHSNTQTSIDKQQYQQPISSPSHLKSSVMIISPSSSPSCHRPSLIHFIDPMIAPSLCESLSSVTMISLIWRLFILIIPAIILAVVYFVIPYGDTNLQHYNLSQQISFMCILIFSAAQGCLATSMSTSLLITHECTPWKHVLGQIMIVTSITTIVHIVFVTTVGLFPCEMLCVQLIWYCLCYACFWSSIPRVEHVSWLEYWKFYTKRYQIIALLEGAIPVFACYLVLFSRYDSGNIRIIIIIAFSIIQWGHREITRWHTPPTATLFQRVSFPWFLNFIMESLTTLSFPRVDDISTFVVISLVQVATHLIQPMTLLPSFFRHKQGVKQRLGIQGQYGVNQPYEDYVIRVVTDYCLTLLAQLAAQVMFLVAAPSMRYGMSPGRFPFPSSAVSESQFQHSIIFACVHMISILVQLYISRYAIQRWFQVDFTKVAYYALQQHTHVWILNNCITTSAIWAIMILDANTLYYFAPWRS